MVTTQHPTLQAALNRVTMTRDFAAGDFAVRDKGEHYLPRPTSYKKEDYQNYIARAYVLGLTGRTKESLVGMIFREPATAELPKQIEGFIGNIDGSGQSLEQVSKQAAGELLIAGRVAFLVDYPQVDAGLDKESEQALNLHPTISTYPIESLINWKHEVINGKQQLTLAVLVEEQDVSENEFSHEHENVYRVLRLRDGVYTQQLYDEKSDPLTDEHSPQMAGGKTFGHIPLHIAGSQDNLPDIDIAPLYQLAVINKAHYQTTADHRENLHIHGQLTLGISTSLSFDEFSQFNPDGIQVGGRYAYVLGEGGSFTSVTAPESSSLRVALQDLEAQAISIGAQLIVRGGQAQTAEAARLDAGAEASALTTLTGNLSEALEACIEDVALFTGDSVDGIELALNTEFWDESPSAQLAQAVVALKREGIIGFEVALRMLESGRINLPEGFTIEQILEAAAIDYEPLNHGPLGGQSLY